VVEHFLAKEDVARSNRVTRSTLGAQVRMIEKGLRKTKNTADVCIEDALGSRLFNPNTEVGGTAFAAIIGSTSRRAILDSINWIQPLRSPTSCAAKHSTAYGPSNFGIRV
jgi:hypothetical protein